MKCYLIAGQSAQMKHTHIERDIFDVFSKSYLNRLIGYYKANISDLTLILPEKYKTIQDEIEEDYPDVTINRMDYSSCSREDTCLFINTKFVYSKSDDIKKVKQLAINAKNEVRIYKRKDHIVGISAPMNKVKALLKDKSSLFLSDDVLDEMAMYFEASDATTAEVTIKKKNILVVQSFSGIQAFMELINSVKLFQLLERGILIWDLKSTWIAPEVCIGEGTVIQPNSIILGDTIIGRGCAIGPCARIENSQLGNEISVKDSTVLSSKIDDFTTVGPYAYLRPNSDIGKNVKVGDFVEVKNSRIDDGSKVSHLSYIGDGFIGKRVNVGCGTVFVNYDGKNKHKTTVNDGAFIGCNANLVAPVTVSEGAFVAAGSTITDDVEANSLAIARSRQVVKTDWKKE